MNNPRVKPLMSFEPVFSRSYRMTNAVVTMHDYSEDTLIFNITNTTGDTPNHAAIWMSRAELQALGKALLEFGASEDDE